MNYDKDMAGFKVKFQTEVILTFYEEFAVIFDDARLRSCNKCIMVEICCLVLSLGLENAGSQVTLFLGFRISYSFLFICCFCFLLCSGTHFY